MPEPAMACRHCKRSLGAAHTTRCVHNRATQSSLVEERHCIITTIQEGREIAEQLVRIKIRCGELGLIRTLAKLDLATKEIGYELAEHPEFKR